MTLLDVRTWLAVRLGRRGAFLLASGFLWVIYGIGFWFRPLSEQPFSDAVFHESIPYRLRAAAWVLAGLLAIYAAFRRSPGRDALGFSALIVMPTLRMASYGYAWLVYCAGLALPLGEAGDPRGWITATFYAVVVSWLLIVSGWPEPGGYAPPRRGDHRQDNP